AVVGRQTLAGKADAAACWRALLGPGRALDTGRDFVVCAHVLGSPYGTASPVTTNPATGRPYGADFPVPTIRDTVALHRLLLERLGVRRVRFAIGGSYGGVQAIGLAIRGVLLQVCVSICVC